MLLALMLILLGLVIVVVTVLNFSSFGIIFAIFTILGGLSTSGMAIMSIVTGKREWILLDLISPF